MICLNLYQSQIESDYTIDPVPGVKFHHSFVDENKLMPTEK